MKAEMYQKKIKMKTYQTGKVNEVPYFIEKKQYQGASGKVYPLLVIDQISDEVIEKEYDMIYLENDYISVHLLPEIGGKVAGAKAKWDGYEFIYENIVVKPALIGLAGPWVSGGVEFNWPQHHRPTTYMPMEYMLQENGDSSVTCFMGEAEPFEHMRATVAVTVHPDTSLMEVKAVVTNCTDHALPFMWWNNTAVRVHEEYKAIFPPDIEYGSDHDRRAIISFPVMKGRFETARPYDYGKGTDTSWFGNVKVPTSVMIPRGETKMNFLGGYDYKKDAGTVIISDYHTSPGKKIFTWGNSEFGKKWCENLTDNDDRYIELMTGVYTDNQPDFAYIEPGETKNFTTFWYPIRGIGGISNAGINGAIRLEKTGEPEKWKAGAVVTRAYNFVKLILKAGGKVIYEKTGSLNPGEFWLEDVTVLEDISPETLCLSLLDENGDSLISYSPVKKGLKKPPKAREAAPDPKNVESTELLYLYGRHLAQYKHGTYRAEDYYLEGIKRNSADYRCNLEMGKIELEKGRMKESQDYFEIAMKRLTFENTSPEDSEIYYQMGRLLRLMDKTEEAYEYFRAAAWQYPYRGPAYFESACISCRLGERQRAVEELKEALAVNTDFFMAGVLLGYLTEDKKMLYSILQKSPLDSFARFALWLLEGRMVEEYVRERPEAVLDAALLFKRAGLKREAAIILESCKKPSLNLKLHLEALTGKTADWDQPDCDFPNRLEDIAVLEKKGWAAQYLLGCLYYARENYEAATEAWEKALKENPNYAFTYRNLAIAYYDHMGRKGTAMAFLKKAVELRPETDRMVYELMQLMKAENVSLKERILLTETYREEVKRRDDAYLDAVILRMVNGEYETARQMLKEKNFHIYEGGEGKLTKYHRWLYILSAMEYAAAGNYGQAEMSMKQALVYPAGYGEGKGFLEQDANIFYFAGKIKELSGKSDEAQHCYERVAEDPEIVNEILFFAGMCEEKLGHLEKAGDYYHRLLEAGNNYAKKEGRYGYFGVGMESPLPFETDEKKNNFKKAHLFRMLGYKGIGETALCEEEKQKLKELEPDFALLAFLEKLEVV